MKMRRIGGLALLIVFLFSFGGKSPDTIAQVSISVEPESKLWITGSSTVSSFTCEASQVDGHGVLSVQRASAVSESGSAERGPEARLAVPVRSFDCGRSRMNADFYEALKSDQYGKIEFELTGVDVLEDQSSDEWHPVRAQGRLTIAGTTRRVDIIASWRAEDANRFRLRGSKSLTMTAFGVRPPVALLGLVRAHDEIEVHFDLLGEAAGI